MQIGNWEALSDKNNAEAKSLSVYPNPTNGTVKISSASLISNIEIFDITEKSVYFKNINNNIATLNTKDFARGLNFAKSWNKEVSIATKLMVE